MVSDILKRVDLHIHTTYSDGLLSPEEVVDNAILSGLSAISITDHDITDGIERALKAGAKFGLEVIPGIELSCAFNGSEIHMLGFYINWENSWFQGKLKVFQRARVRRARQIYLKLKKLGVKIEEEDLFSQAGEGSIGRIHFARALLSSGEVKSIQEAFDRYLVKGKPGYVAKLRITPEEGMSMIQKAGGLPVIAHPVFGGGHKAFLKRMKASGLSGIEAYHPGHTASQKRRLLASAGELGLMVTGGTDSHGGDGESSHIGSIEIDYSVVDALKREKRRRERGNRRIMV